MDGKVFAKLFDDIFKLGEVGMKEPDFAGGISQALLGEFKVAGIDIQADQGAFWAELFGDLAGMPGPAEGAVDDRLAGDKCKTIQDFGEQNRVVASVWELHRTSKMTSAR